MPVYNLSTIYDMLHASFSVREIDTLAFKLFPRRFNQFGKSMHFSEKIRQIIMMAEQNGRLPEVIAYTQKHNPYQYKRFADHLE